MSRSYKDKLYNFEVQPPPVVWDRISNELLGENELTPFPGKLYDYEVIPPASAWNKINSSLKRDNITLQDFSVIKPAKRLPYRLAAAAATLGVIALGVLYFSQADISKQSLTINNIKNSADKKITSEKSILDPSLAPEEPEVEKSAEISPATFSKITKNYGATIKKLQNTTVKNSLFRGNELQIMIAAKPIRNANGEIIQNPEIMNNPASRYISITGPNGEQTKISSKFLHMLLFINDASDVDEVDGYFDKNFLESLIWKSRFQEWRNKIINTSYVPSSTNFMDILDFKDLITKDR